MFTGAYPTYHGVRKNGEFALDPAFDTVAEILSGAGYRTAALDPAFCLTAASGSRRDSRCTTTSATSGATRAHGAGRRTATRRGHRAGPRAPTHHSLEPERRAPRPSIVRSNGWRARRAKPIFPFGSISTTRTTPRTTAGAYRTIFTGAQYRGEIAAMDREIGRLIDAFERAAAA